MRARPRAPVVPLTPLPFRSLARDRAARVDGEYGDVTRQPHSARIIARFSG
jgi:hypothetical protein